MKKIQLSLLLTVIILSAFSCTSLDRDLYFKETAGFKKNIRLAVIPFEDASNAKNSGINVSDALTNELIKIRNWDIVERTQIMKVIKEQSFEITGMTERDYSKLGKLTNVDYFIAGSLGQYAHSVDKENDARIRICINLRFIDTTHGKIIGTGRYTYFTSKNYLRSCCLTGWFFIFVPDRTIDKELTNVARSIVQDMKIKLQLQ
ncbi:MAG TPA: CsgG/HfaB family protein [Spirochaetota bacterium]|nr:CsgG/HfaB family protein [Spirochaetota bacterium]